MHCHPAHSPHPDSTHSVLPHPAPASQVQKKLVSKADAACFSNNVRLSCRPAGIWPAVSLLCIQGRVDTLCKESGDSLGARRHQCECCATRRHQHTIHTGWLLGLGVGAPCGTAADGRSVWQPASCRRVCSWSQLRPAMQLQPAPLPSVSQQCFSQGWCKALPHVVLCAPCCASGCPQQS